MTALKQTGQWVRQQQPADAWRADRDTIALGILLAGILTWVDIHPPEGLTWAFSYLITRLVQVARRRKQ